jgi:zeaxanthin glucosyltransferase
MKKLNRKFDFSQLNWNKCFHVGFKNIPVWVVSADEFDFPRQKSLPFLHHLGATTDLNRKEIHDPHFNDLIKKLDNKKIIYCSLGTISVLHNKNGVEFLKKITACFSHRKDWALIISCGQIDVNQLGTVANNVHLFQKVPQLSVIRLSEFVITHAGSNTVKECVLLGKPMLAFPLSSKWDQNGIAARVVYHKMGLSGDINKITIKELSLMIDTLTANLIYKENTLKMSKIFQEKNDNLEATILELFNSDKR